MDEHKLTRKSHWQSRKRIGTYKAHKYRVPFLDILRRFIPEGENGKLSCLEVGCVPGRFLLYFNKVLGYRIEGIDYSDEISSVEKILRYHNVQNYKLYREDFFEFSPKYEYDLVCSFGFVEHFNNTLSVIDAHSKHSKKGGYILFTVPNIRFLQKWFISRNNPEMLKACNLDIMEPSILRGMLKDKYDIKYCGYVGTIRLYGRTKNKNYGWKIISYILKKITSLIDGGLQIAKMNLSNKYTSPHIAVVLRKDN